jgi:two-component system phosphate regulon response regulator PhoB
MTAHRTPPQHSDLSVESQPTILIVEDDPALREFLSELLKGEGYRPFCAESGTQALQMLAEITPDLVLLDLCLPDFDGYEVCQRIRAMTEQRIPILMVSANRDPLDVLAALHVGVDDYLRKPFDVEELLAQVRAHLPLVLPLVEDQSMPVILDVTEPAASARALDPSA